MTLYIVQKCNTDFLGNMFKEKQCHSLKLMLPHGSSLV